MPLFLGASDLCLEHPLALTVACQREAGAVFRELVPCSRIIMAETDFRQGNNKHPVVFELLRQLLRLVGDAQTVPVRSAPK